MRRIADICDAFDKIDGVEVAETGGVTLCLQNGIAVKDEHGDVYGWLGDEIGGAWSFWPQKENPYASNVGRT
jgi:hypothetical protein